MTSPVVSRSDNSRSGRRPGGFSPTGGPHVDRLRIIEPPGLLRCVEERVRFCGIGTDLAERRDVVENPERAPVRGNDKIVIP